MSGNERALKRMSAGDIIDYSIEVYKRNFKSVTILSLMFYVPFTFLVSLVSNFFTGELTKFGKSQSVTPEMSGAYILVFLAIGLLYVFYLLTIHSVMTSAVTKVIYDDIVYKRNRKLKTVISESFKKFPSLFGYTTLLYLIMVAIIFGVMFLIGIIFFIFAAVIGIFGVASVGMGSTAGIGAFVVVGVILYLLMGFILVATIAFFYVKFGFGIQVIAIENKSATEGISRSMTLSKTNFWSSFWALAFGFLLYGFLPMLAVGLVQILSFVDSQIYNSIYLVANTSLQIIQSLFYPFIITLITVIFINMKIKNEGLDLEVKVDNLMEMQQKSETEEKADAYFET